MRRRTAVERIALVFCCILTGLAVSASQSNAYVPAPNPATTNYLIGANYFGGWQQGENPNFPFGWERFGAFPSRTPLLGYYDGGSPEVADWEIKWALENGISYFNYDWYRKGTNTVPTPNNQILGNALNNGMLNAVYRNQFHFTISFTASDVSGAPDLLNNVLPYWINTYFRESLLPQDRQ